MNNIELLEASLQTIDALEDPYYEKEKVIISGSPREKNSLMLAHEDLIEKIGAYKVAMQTKNKRAMRDILILITQLLGTESGINYTEFVTYWALVGVSYSTYQKLEEGKKKQFLERILPLYIEKRYKLYQSHGYSATTLQVQCDSYAHKRSGSSGLKKIYAILTEAGLKEYQGKSAKELLSRDKVFINTGKRGKMLFGEVLKIKDLKFEWRLRYTKKSPDALFILNKRIFIVEHKHKNEGGGGQLGQIAEVLDFIRQKERARNISYIGYMDGVYFKEFVSVQSESGKTKSVLREFRQALEKNPQNYFVNTHGLKELVKINM